MTSTPLRSTRGRRLLADLVSAGLVVLGFLAVVRASQGGITVDYVAFATGGRLAASDPHHLYSIGAQANVQAGLLGYRPTGSSFPQLFVNPPFVAELMRPFAGFSLQTGTDIFCMLLLFALLIAAGGLAARWRDIPRSDARAMAAIACISTAGCYGVLIGQWTPVLEIAAVATILLLDRGHRFAAGIALSLLLVKPQLVWLVVPGFAIVGLWRMLFGFVVGGAVLGLISVAVVGIDGVRDYVSLLKDYSVAPIAMTGRSIADIAARFANDASIIPAVTASVTVLALIAVVVMRRHLREEAVALVVLVTLSLVTSSHTNPEDFGILCFVPGVLLLRAPRAVVTLFVLGNAAVVLALYFWQIPLDVIVPLAGLGLMARAGLTKSRGLVGSTPLPAAD